MPAIKKYVESLIESSEKIQLNIPYLKFLGKDGDDYRYHNYIEKAIEFYGKPIDVIPKVAYFEIDASRFYECIDKGCPCCGKDKLRYLGFPPSEYFNHPEYTNWPGAYDLPGVMPKMGCSKCRLYIGVDKRWIPEDYVFKYHINDRVRLKNGMEASITEVIDDDRFVADTDYSEGTKTENINREEIEHILRRYK